jgi:hypothetical protein
VKADVDHLCTTSRPKGDIAAQMALIPVLVRELNALYATAPERRRDVLEALMLVLVAAALAAKYLGAKGTPGLAAMYAKGVAQELEDERWIGLAKLVRVQTLGSGNRDRARELAIAAADEIQPRIGTEPARQLYGMLHLNCALASATLGQPDRSAAHMQEAREMAAAGPDPDGLGWAGLLFSETNVRFWDVALAVEFGDLGRVPELSEDIHPERVASWSRQGAYYVDLARALATVRGRADDAVAALSRAESLSPVATRVSVWSRETVSDLLRRVKRDARAGRELRGLAYRMGLAA